MKTFRNLFILTIFVLVGGIFHSFSPVTNRQNNEQELLARANLLSLQFPQEKIYLHLDRPSYWANDDIWFKAYLLNTAIPECNLYVELLNSEGDVIDKKISWAQNGLAYGDFHLDETMESGIYQIRAYTNWMRNFDENWFFHKNLIIWNLQDKSIKTDLVDLKSKDIDLQFFPEGGTLVANVNNRVAFKAVDKFGKGISVNGVIVDDRGNQIIDFKSGFKGMGSFVFEPREGRKYTAHAVIGGNISINIDLPAPQSEGIKLEVNPNGQENIHLQVSKNSPGSGNNQNAEYLILGQKGGQICYRKQITSTEKTFNLEIEKKLLPTGIIKFTVFDNDFVPQCERLVFVNHNDYVNVKIEPDKSEYLTLEKVELNVEAITNAGIPCLSNLSLSVFNPENNSETEKYPNNILTQFLLNSELKGTIEDPAWYFKDDSLSTLIALDNLMLTQGYRYFEWKEIKENKLPEIVYEPENSLQLRGEVLNWFSKKPVEDCNVTMMFVKSQLAVYEQTTDSLGNFVFTDQKYSKKGKKKNLIVLDDRSSVSPTPGFLPANYRYNNENQLASSYFLSETNDDLINKKWHLNDTILLGDINVVTKKLKKDDGNFRPYLDADYVFDVRKQEDIYTDIFDMLETTSPYMRNYLANQSPEYYLDGVRVEADFLNGLSASWFDKIEAVRMAPVATGFGPALYFYTKRGETQKKIYDPLGMKSTKIAGYSVIRRFYSPRYDSRTPADMKNDFRSTLYWNPIVRTDSTGVAQVSFFNSGEAGNIQIVVEGITADGKLCRGLGGYSVKKSNLKYT